MVFAETSYRPPRRKPAHDTLGKTLAAAKDQLRVLELESFPLQGLFQRTGLSVGAFCPGVDDDAACSALTQSLGAFLHGSVPETRPAAATPSKTGSGT